MRLYLGEDGLGYCDCMEGWLPFEGRCYQELTPANPLCPDQQILLLKNPIVPDFIFPGDNSDSIQRQIQFNYSCIESPCNSTSLPHRFVTRTMLVKFLCFIHGNHIGLATLFQIDQTTFMCIQKN